MNETNLNRKYKPDSGQRLALATGSYVVLAADTSEDNAIAQTVYPSYGIARVEAHLKTLQCIEAATQQRLAVPYQRELELVRQRCADDLEAWAIHGFMGDIEPIFSATTRTIHPEMLKRAGFGTARYLLADARSENVASQPTPFHSLHDELLSEYVRTNLPGLWRGVTDARELLRDWLHGKAIRALALRYPEYAFEAVEVAVPQHQCSRASVASVAGKIQTLLSWYAGANRAAVSQNFSSPSDWQQLLSSSEILPGVDAETLWIEASQLIAAANVSVGVDSDRRSDRDKLQQAALHWAQWGLWSRQQA